MLWHLLRNLLKDPQQQILLLVIDYLQEENRMLKHKLEKSGKRLLFTPEERRTLAIKGKVLHDQKLTHYIKIVQPETLMRWYRKLIAKKYDSSKKPRRIGRPEIPPHHCKLILKLARENKSWGSLRIHGQLKALNIEVSHEAIRQLLRKHGFSPDGKKQSQGTWRAFIKRHKDVLWATDFFTCELLNLKGIKTIYILFFIHIQTRRVVIAGTTEHPNMEWMKQQARNLTAYDGELKDAKFLIHDRDTKYCQDFTQVLHSSGIKTIKLPPRSPNLNAYAERFVRSIKEECLSKFILLNEKMLHHVLKEYLAHYHNERAHQGHDIGNCILFPDGTDPPDEQLEQFEIGHLKLEKHVRLGGLLNFYSKAA